MSFADQWKADLKRKAISDFLSKPLDELKAEIAPILADLSGEQLHSLKNLIDHELLLPHRKSEMIVQTTTGYHHSGIEYNRQPGT